MKFAKVIFCSFVFISSTSAIAYDRAIDGTSLIATAGDPAVAGYCRLGFPDTYGDGMATVVPFEHWENPGAVEFVKFYVALPDYRSYYRPFSPDIAKDCRFNGGSEGAGIYLIDTLKYRSETVHSSPIFGGQYSSYAVDIKVKGVDTVFKNMDVFASPASQLLENISPILGEAILKSKRSGKAVKIQYAYDHE